MKKLLLVLFLPVLFAMGIWWIFDDHDTYITAADKNHIATFYNYWGSLQDYQTIYEAKAIKLLDQHCEIKNGHNVFEYGYGTGNLAFQFLLKYPNIKYNGVDISTTMYKLATSRLKRFELRKPKLVVSKKPIDSLKILPDGSIDRFVSTYVFDLLNRKEVYEIMEVLKRKLKSDGKICLTSLTSKYDKKNWISKTLIHSWKAISRLCPICLGGCRPIDLNDVVQPHKDFKIEFEEIVEMLSLPSQVVVAKKVE